MGCVWTAPHGASSAVVGGLLVASAVLGVADATIALWLNRAIAPHATVPLCLTAPFAASIAVLLPASLLLAVASRTSRRDPSEIAAGLLAVVGGAATL
ncbi:MAG: hypothetical protein AB1689_00105, partial [Thermodesulfobacteriota bacterium]